MVSERFYCVFKVGPIQCCLEVRKIQEILINHQTTFVPMANSHIEGLLNIRGEIVIAVDLRKLLKINSELSSSQPMSVVVRTHEGPVALVVDSIGDVLEVPTGIISGVPDTLKFDFKHLVTGVTRVDDQISLILNYPNLIASILSLSA